MKGHNQNKYLHNYIKSNNLTPTEWTEYRINLGRKDLVCDPGFATESPEPACVSGSLPARGCCAGWTLCGGNCCPEPGVVIPGLDWVLWIIPHWPQ